jgi:putative Mn2+ efflux pump MntP
MITMTSKMKTLLSVVFLLVGILMTVLLFMGWHVGSQESSRSTETMSANILQLTVGRVGLDEDFADDAFEGMDDAAVAARLDSEAEDRAEENKEANKSIRMRPWYILAFAAPLSLIALGVFMMMGQVPLVRLMSLIALAALILSLLLCFMARGVNYGKDMVKYQLKEMTDEQRNAITDEDVDEMIARAKRGYASTNADLGFGGMATLVLAAMALPVVLMMMLATPAPAVASASAAPAAPAPVPTPVEPPAPAAAGSDAESDADNA